MKTWTEPSISSTPHTPRTPRAISRVTFSPRFKFYDHGKWTYPHHFAVMLLVSSTVLPEFAEFPTRCFEYGGLIFFVIYAFIFIAFGLPMVLLESQFGQYLGQSSYNVIRNICPAAGGIGMIQLLTVYMELMKNQLIVYFMINYLFSSMIFTSHWRLCGHHWSSMSYGLYSNCKMRILLPKYYQHICNQIFGFYNNCYTKVQDDICFKSNSYFWNNTCSGPKTVCRAFKMIYFNDTHCLLNETLNYIPDILNRLHTTPGHDYFFYLVNTDFNSKTEGNIYFVVNYTLGWVLSYVAVFNGLNNKIAVRVAHIIVITVNLMLIFLFVAALMQSGGVEGVVHGFKIADLDWYRFIDYKTWFYALREVVENLNIGFIINTVLASFNQFDSDLIKPILYSGFFHLAFHQLIYSVFTYSLWGVASKRQGKDIKYFSDRASGDFAIILMFPDLHLRHSAPQFWATIFFAVLTFRGIGANIIALEALVISLGDISNLCRQHPKIVRLLLCILMWCCGCCFVVSDPFDTLVLVYKMVSFDYYIMMFVELIVFGVIYGFASDKKNRQFEDLYEMVGWNGKLYFYLRIVYYIMVPLIAVFFTIAKFITFEFPKNSSSHALTVLYLAKSPILLLIYAFITIFRANYSGKSFKSIITPTENWYPQPITAELAYKPDYSHGSIKYKIAMLLNKIGFEL